MVSSYTFDRLATMMEESRSRSDTSQKRNASAAGRDYYDDGSEYSDDDD